MSGHTTARTARDHFACIFGATGIPPCDGEVALGNSMLIAEGTGDQQDRAYSIVSDMRDTGVREG